MVDEDSNGAIREAENLYAKMLRKSAFGLIPLAFMVFGLLIPGIRSSRLYDGPVPMVYWSVFLLSGVFAVWQLIPPIIKFDSMIGRMSDDELLLAAASTALPKSVRDRASRLREKSRRKEL